MLLLFRWLITNAHQKQEVMIAEYVWRAISRAVRIWVTTGEELHVVNWDESLGYLRPHQKDGPSNCETMVYFDQMMISPSDAYK